MATKPDVEFPGPTFEDRQFTAESGYGSFDPFKEQGATGWMGDEYKKMQSDYYKPSMDKYMSSAMDDINVASRKEQAASDVAQQFGNQKTQLARDLGRYGIDPGSSSWKKSMSDLAIGQAGATAGAVTGAGERASSEQFSRLSDLASKTSPMMQAYMQTRAGVDQDRFGTLSNLLGGMYGSELGFQSNQYGTDVGYLQNKERIEADKELAKLGRSGGGGGGSRRSSGGSSRSRPDYEGYNRELQTLLQQQDQNLGQLYSAAPEPVNPWEQLAWNAAGTAANTVVGGVVNAGVDWLFGP